MSLHNNVKLSDAGKQLGVDADRRAHDFDSFSASRPLTSELCIDFTAIWPRDEWRHSAPQLINWLPRNCTHNIYCLSDWAFYERSTLKVICFMHDPSVIILLKRRSIRICNDFLVFTLFLDSFFLKKFPPVPVQCSMLPVLWTGRFNGANYGSRGFLKDLNDMR